MNLNKPRNNVLFLFVQIPIIEYIEETNNFKPHLLPEDPYHRYQVIEKEMRIKFLKLIVNLLGSDD